jgi:hypothetical protein
MQSDAILYHENIYTWVIDEYNIYYAMQLSSKRLILRW